MPVKEIVDGTLRLSIQDQELASRLEKLDTNRDAVISLEDVAAETGLTDVERRKKMLDAVADVFVQDQMAKMPNIDSLVKLESFQSNLKKLRPIRDFFDLYQKVERFEKLVSELQKNKISVGGRELEFGSDYWKANVLPYMSGEGEFTPAQLSSLAQGLYTIVHQLVGGTVNDKAHVPQDLGITCYTPAGFEYAQNEIPEMLRVHVAKIVEAYVSSANWLFQYDDIECEGRGCPNVDEITLRGLTIFSIKIEHLVEITPSQKNRDIFFHCEPPIHP